MPVYSYRAFDPAGRTTTGVLDAESPVAARSKLREMGLVPTRVDEAASSAGTRSLRVQQFFPARISERDLAIFTRQMAVLVRAGMPLVEALSAVMEQVDHAALATVVLRLKEGVSQGMSFSDALAQFPHWFNQMYVNMVRAGEAAGALDVVLGRLSDYLERRGKVRRRVQAAMTYPALMTVVGLGVLTFLLAYIVPQVTRIFFDLGHELPLATRILLAVSGFIQVWWWMLAVGLVGSVLGVRAYLATPPGRAQWDALRLRIPVLRRLTESLIISRFSRTLGTLLQSGLPVLEAMTIVANVVNHVQFEAAIAAAQEGVRKGDDLAGALRRTGVFPSIVLHMVALGERSSELDEMLLRTADAADDELDAHLTSLVSLVEPGMILLMGGIVGFVVLAILLPIFELNTQLG